jgi:hypothetical protein
MMKLLTINFITGDRVSVNYPEAQLNTMLLEWFV